MTESGDNYILQILLSFKIQNALTDSGRQRLPLLNKLLPVGSLIAQFDA